MGSKISADNLITKSNKLIEAAYKLTEIEQKVILTLIGLVQPTDREFQSYTFSIKDFIKLIGGNSNTRYKELEEITRNMLSKIHEIRFEDRLIQVQWLSQADYNYKKGTIELTLHNFLTPYLLELKREFTSYQLKNVSKLKGQYSIRIYELLKQYERLRERTFDMDDLRNKLGVTDIYTAYGNFKQRILVPSQKQINNKSDISFEFQEIKQGRSVKKVKFLINAKDAVIQPLPRPSTKDKNKKEVEISTQEVASDLFAVMEEDDILEIHKLALDIGFKVPKKIIESWLEFRKDNVLKIMESIRGNNRIENPIGFISYKLKTGVNEEFIKLDEKEEIIHQFIIENTPKQKVKRIEILPDWLVEGTALEYFKKFMTEEKASDLWKERKEEIIADLKGRRQKMQMGY